MSLENDLRNVSIAALEIGNWIGVAAGTTVADTVRRMRDEKTNCALIKEGEKLIGIFTDHDVLHKVLGHSEVWQQPVESLMTADPKSIRPEDGPGAALSLMDGNKIRNVPVVDREGKVMGNVAQQTFVRYLSDRFHTHVYNQPPEFEQYTRTRHGA